MDRVLVTYGSKYGATAGIAETIGRTLEDRGFDVDVTQARAVKSVDGYRAAVVGSAVYAAHWRGEALRFMRHNRRWLAEHDVWLFSSGPVGEDDQEADDADTERWTKPRKARELAEEVGARDHIVFGGMVDDDKGFMRKKMAQNMPEETRDRRDWDEIEAWANAIADALGATPG